MAIGGPAAFASGFMSGFLRAQQHARARALQDALRMRREQRFEEEYRQRQQAAYERAAEARDRAQARFQAAAAEHDALLREMERTRTSRGKPYKDAGLERRLVEARDAAVAARQEAAEHRDTLMKLVGDYNERLEKSVAPQKAGGFLGFGQHETTDAEKEAALRDMPREELGQRILEAQRKSRDEPTADDKEFEASRGAELKGLGKSTAAQTRADRNIRGLEAEGEEGRRVNEASNEAARSERLFNLEEKDRRAQAEMASEQADLDAASRHLGSLPRPAGPYPGMMPGGGGGYAPSAAGKGGGIGASPGTPNIVNAVGAILAPIGRALAGLNQVGRSAPQSRQGSTVGKGGSVPITNSTYDPRTGQFTGQTGLDWYRQRQAAAPIDRTVLGEVIGGGRTQPSFGARSLYGPRDPLWSGPMAPVRSPPPSIDPKGAGGGLTPQVQRFASGSPDPAVIDAINNSGGSPRAKKLMLGIYAGESAHVPGRYDTNISGTERSYGPFQMNTMGGLGNEAARAGIDVRNPATVPRQAKWLASQLDRNPGLVSQFYGYRDRGKRMTESGWGKGLINLSQDRASPASSQDRSKTTINQRHIDYLRKNPKLAPAFDEKFGRGSAARFLGGGAL